VKKSGVSISSAREKKVSRRKSQSRLDGGREGFGRECRVCLKETVRRPKADHKKAFYKNQSSREGTGVYEALQLAQLKRSGQRRSLL